MKNKNKNEGGFLFFLFILLLGGFFGFCKNIRASDNCDDHVIISEIYGGGGNSGAIYKNDFIELYNPTNQAVGLENWTIQYASATGNFPTTIAKTTLLLGEIKAGSYYLIREAGGENGEPLPIADATGLINLAATGGKVVLANKGALISSVTDSSAIEVINYEGSANNKISAYRMGLCSDVFDKHAPDPQNSLWKEPWTEPEPEPIPEPEPPVEKITCVGNSSDIKINEIYPYTENTNDEFVEIKNTGEKCVDISDWTIKDDTAISSHKTIFTENTILESGKYFYIQKNLYLNNDTDIVYLLNKDGLEIDKREYKEASRAQSSSFDGISWRWTSKLTPGTENEFDIPTEVPEEPDSGLSEEYSVYLNEVLPNPKGTDSEGEFIEFYNSGITPENLENWTLKDKNGNAHILKKIDGVSLEIKSLGYLIINPNDYGTSLHNTVDENMALLDPKGALVSSFSYNGQGIKEDVSYNFDGTDWHWSRFLTPGKENIFNNLPEVSKKRDDKIYADVYADFSAKGYDADKDKLKFTWDFGDGHKSYLKKAKHKFKKAGKYKVTLKVSDGSGDKIETFNIKVEKFPKSQVKIVSVSPNPTGKDSAAEFITLQNKSKKKINLKDWSVATGSKNLYNHPITEDLVIKPGKTITLTRNFSKFALNNKKAEIELRYPNGKVASQSAYDKKKESVAEGEIYTKESGQWAWVAPKPETKLAIADSIPNPTPLPIEKEKEEIKIAKEEKTPEEIVPASGGIVAGASTEENFDPPQPQKISYPTKIFRALNSAINYFLNKFFTF